MELRALMAGTVHREGLEPLGRKDAMAPLDLTVVTVTMDEQVLPEMLEGPEVTDRTEIKARQGGRELRALEEGRVLMAVTVPLELMEELELLVEMEAMEITEGLVQPVQVAPMATRAEMV